MEVFELEGKLKLDGAEKVGKQLGGLQSKVQKMAKGLRIAGAGMTALGGIITGVAVKSVMDFAEMGDEVHKMSLRTGFATESLSKLKYAAAIGGAGLGDVEKAAKRMASTIYDAGEGLSTAVDALDNLGLSVEDLQGLSPEEQFMKLAGAIADVEDPSMRSALAQRIFGKAGTELLPMLSEGTEGLKAMMEEAEKFSPIFGKEAAEAAANLTDGMGRLKGTMEKVKMTIAEKLVPILIPLIERIAETISRVTDWMKENPELTRTIALVAAAVGGILLVLGPLLILLPTLVAALPMLGAAFAVMLGPVGLIIAAIAGLVAVGILVWRNWDTISGKAQEIWGGIVSFFETIPEKIGKVFSTLKDIMLAPFRAAWQAIGRGINWLIDQLNKIKVEIPSWIPGIGGKSFGINLPRITLPEFKTGGIFTRPVAGVIGDVPEAVLPLSKLRGMGTTVNVYNAGSVITERELVSRIREVLLETQSSNVNLGWT